MKLHNLRLGFATNSSSTHSIILVPNSKRYKDKDIEGGEFGWNFFTASSVQAKGMYLARLLYDAMSYLGQDVAEAVVNQWMGPNVHNGMSYIDHQSVMVLPRDWNNKAVDKNFFDAFKNFLLSDSVIIVGGNDNTDEKHSALNNSKNQKINLGLPLDSYNNDGLVCRKENDYWVVFNRKDGTKTRISFNQPVDFNPVKANTPELVDIKITDYCPFNCSYCYQASTIKGKSAHLNTINIIAESLSIMKTFEVALGGGEPTMHPNFISILKSFRSKGIVPNFTTKSLHWIKDNSLRQDILKYIGSFAYSAETASDVYNFASVWNATEQADFGIKKPVIHYVMGIGSEKDLVDVLKAAKDNSFEVTLLGYKNIGRGCEFAPKPYYNWVQTVMDAYKKGQCPTLGIDTKLAQESSIKLEEAGIPDYMYHIEEGKFSMYIDAVNGLVAPSSYCNKSEMKELFFNNYEEAGKLQAIFKEF